MDIIDHEPHDWFLLRDGDAFFLDVNCNVSATSFDMLIQLSPEERAEYQKGGRVFVQSLAAKVQDSSKQYFPRNLERSHGERVMKAISAWRGSSET
jgi:hypothetical protein